MYRVPHAGGCQHIVVTSENLYIGDYTGGDPSCRGSAPDASLSSFMRQYRNLRSVPVIDAVRTGSHGVPSAPPAGRSSHSAFAVELEAVASRNAFLLDYVIHTQQGVGGPHSIEVNLRDANLYWPFLHDIRLVWDIVTVYSHFARVRFVHRNPPDFAHSRWMFINLVLTDGQLLAVVPQPAAAAPGPASDPKTSWLPALAIRWDVLRVGYDWGANQESVLLATLRQLVVSIVKGVRMSEKRKKTQRVSEQMDTLNLEHPDLLRPTSGIIRWQAAKPPFVADTSASGELGGDTASGRSELSQSPSFLSVASRLISQSGEQAPDGVKHSSTSHHHTLSVEFDSLRPQLVLQSRWYLHSLINSLKAACKSEPTSASKSRRGHPRSNKARNAGPVQAPLPDRSGSSPERMQPASDAIMAHVPSGACDSIRSSPYVSSTARNGAGTATGGLLDPQAIPYLDVHPEPITLRKAKAGCACT